jgi:ribosomal protein S8
MSLLVHHMWPDSALHIVCAVSSMQRLRRWTVFAGYIGEFEFVDDHRGGKIVVELNGRWGP